MTRRQEEQSELEQKYEEHHGVGLLVFEQVPDDVHLTEENLLAQAHVKFKDRKAVQDVYSHVASMQHFGPMAVTSAPDGISFELYAQGCRAYASSLRHLLGFTLYTSLTKPDWLEECFDCTDEESSSDFFFVLAENWETVLSGSDKELEIIGRRE